MRNPEHFWDIGGPDKLFSESVIARHEAGHAVGHHVMGHCLELLTVVPTDDSDGRCVLREIPPPTASVEDKLAILMMGALAEHQQLIMPDWYELEEPDDDSYNDSSCARRLLEESFASAPERLEAAEAALARATELDHRHFWAIENLAVALWRRRTMPGGTAHRVIARELAYEGACANCGSACPTSRYCNRSCAERYRARVHRLEATECFACGEAFRGRSGQRYCSVRCYQWSRRLIAWAKRDVQAGRGARVVITTMSAITNHPADGRDAERTLACSSSTWGLARPLEE
jgi:hypothetical protein